MSEHDLAPAVVPTRLDDSVKGVARIVSRGLGWARKYSIFTYPYSTADLLLVVGTINLKQAPILKRVWEQMCEPKWVVAFGVCASSGGFYDNYAVLQGIDRVIPVDVYIPGCPPRPEQVLDGLMLLQQKIQSQRHRLIEREPKAAAPAGERPGLRDLVTR